MTATKFLVQLGTAFVSRTAPRVHRFALSVSVAAGLVVLRLAAPAICTAIAAQMRHLPDALASLGMMELAKQVLTLMAVGLIGDHVIADALPTFAQLSAAAPLDAVTIAPQQMASSTVVQTRGRQLTC